MILHNRHGPNMEQKKIQEKYGVEEL